MILKYRLFKIKRENVKTVERCIQGPKIVQSLATTPLDLYTGSSQCLPVFERQYLGHS